MIYNGLYRELKGLSALLDSVEFAGLVVRVSHQLPLVDEAGVDVAKQVFEIDDHFVDLFVAVPFGDGVG